MKCAYKTKGQVGEHDHWEELIFDSNRYAVASVYSRANGIEYSESQELEELIQFMNFGVESSFEDIQRSISQFKAKHGEVADAVLSFEDAHNRVLKVGEEDFQEYFDDIAESDINSRNKAMFAENKRKLKRIIERAYYSENYDVEGYTNKGDFIEDSSEEILGRSVLSHAFKDDDVSDIFCMAWNNIWVERKGVNEPYPYHFRDANHYEEVIKRILQFEGREVNQGDNKIVNTTFYEDRVTITDESVSPKGYSMTIRKHSEDHITLQQIVNGQTFTQEVADLLGMMIRGEQNLIYAGITGSGKTTSIRALLDYYVAEANKRMVVAEDTQELFPENPHTLELRTVETGDPKTTVDLRDLIMLSLRLKPKYIVVGEVRGPEAESAVEGMATGHSTIFTMHGGNAWDIVNRLITKYLSQMPELSIEVVERTIGNAVDYIAIQDDIPNIGRRMTSLKEVSYDYEKRTTRLVPIIEFDFESNQFVQVNKLSPDKASFMMRRGLPFDEIQDQIREDADIYIETLEEYKAIQQGRRKEPSRDGNTYEEVL